MVQISKVGSRDRSAATPEDLEAQNRVPRQHGDSGRPYLWKPDGSKRTYYGRPSGLGGDLDGKEQLMAWKSRMVLDGIHRVPELLDEYREVISKPGYDPKDHKHKGRVQAIADRAQEIANAVAKADIGTALHDITDAIDWGRDPGWIPPEFEAVVGAYCDAVAIARRKHGLEFIDSEFFVAYEPWKVAGSVDKLVRFDGKLVVADAKTSGTMEYSRGKFCMQVAPYAWGVRYSPRGALNGIDRHGLGVGRSPYVEGEQVEREYALIIHFASGGRECQFLKVPLAPALEGYDTLMRVREWRNRWNRKANRFEEEPIISVERGE